MNPPSQPPEGSEAVRQTKSFPRVCWILALLLVVVVLSFFLISSPWWKFVGIQTALGLLGLWTALASFKHPKK